MYVTKKTDELWVSRSRSFSLSLSTPPPVLLIRATKSRLLIRAQQQEQTQRAQTATVKQAQHRSKDKGKVKAKTKLLSCCYCLVCVCLCVSVSVSLAVSVSDLFLSYFSRRLPNMSTNLFADQSDQIECICVCSGDFLGTGRRCDGGGGVSANYIANTQSAANDGGFLTPPHPSLGTTLSLSVCTTVSFFFGAATRRIA